MESESDPAEDPAREHVTLESLAARLNALEREIAGMRARDTAPALARSEVAPPPLPRVHAAPPAPVAAQGQGVVEAASASLVSAKQEGRAPDRSAAPTLRTESQTLENRLGSQVFNMVGIVAIIFAAAWFLKLAIENGWIGPRSRVLVGLAAGAGLVLWSEVFRRRRMAAFSYSLKALGSGLLYLSLWAAFQLYHLLPAGVALLLMVLVTAWNAFMACSQDAELLAGYALAGGMLTPLLLSTGANHETFLFSYLAMLDAGVVLLVRWKPWNRLLVPAFVATAGYFIGWYVQFFHGSGAGMDAVAWETAGFALVFFAIFAPVFWRGWGTGEGAASPDEIIAPVLLPLANAAFIGGALYSVLQDSGLHDWLTWMTVALAAVYLGLMRLQRTALGAAIHLAIAVVFLTIAIPLKTSGHTLTAAWLTEGLVLLWASTRVEDRTSAPARVLRALSLGGYGLGLSSLVVHWTFAGGADADFFNANLGSALLAFGVLAAGAWLVFDHAEPGAEKQAGLVPPLAAIDGVALLLVGRELASAWMGGAAARTPFANADFATALVGLGVLAANAWAAYRAHRERGDSLERLGGVTLVLFNLLTILSVEHEIGALWSRTDANLQRSLAISAFLMLYGAALLAAGFWRRSAFVRWQALLLLVFTIAKVFLYDIGGLSQGYRVVSFFALGVLLLTVSFAYQKDWLGLKEPHAIADAEQDA